MEMASGGRRTAVIANAADVYAPSDRADAVERELASLREFGLEPEELDLRDFFDSPNLAAALERFDIVWARGGDVFTLRYSMARSRADAALVDLLSRDAFVYGGYSAGVCVLGPTLRGLEQVDNPEHLNFLYGVEPTWPGLGVLDYCIVPHYDSPDHPESEACGRLAEHYRTKGTAHRVLRDGEVLVVDGTDTDVCR